MWGGKIPEPMDLHHMSYEKFMKIQSCNICTGAIFYTNSCMLIWSKYVNVMQECARRWERILNEKVFDQLDCLFDYHRIPLLPLLLLSSYNSSHTTLYAIYQKHHDLALFLVQNILIILYLGPSPILTICVIYYLFIWKAWVQGHRSSIH